MRGLVVGDSVGGEQTRLHTRDASSLGAPAGARCWCTPRRDDERAREAQAARARELRASTRERDPTQSVRVFRSGGVRPQAAMMVAFIDKHRDAYGGGRRPDVRRDVGGLCLRRVRHRRVLARHRRLARLELAAHRPRTRCARASAARASARRRARPHSDAGVQYVSIRYTERLAAAGLERSVGSVGDSYATRSLRPSSVCSRRSRGSTGSTIVASSNRSATCHLRNSKRRTINNTVRRWLPDSRQQASGDPGAVHSAMHAWIRR